MHYVLFYDYVQDYLERRGSLRDAHLVLATAAVERDELILGGAFAGPTDGGMLLFSGSSPAVAENFAKADPYVTKGLVTKWRVREWTTVVGKDAAYPAKPATSE
ncbi:MAG: YciI family protein [Proteobacteria bacterium]|nr:YciI family protein [Pseudomonadota bacterium]